jgi:hypothetical protein
MTVYLETKAPHRIDLMSICDREALQRHNAATAAMVQSWCHKTIGWLTPETMIANLHSGGSLLATVQHTIDDAHPQPAAIIAHPGREADFYLVRSAYEAALRQLDEQSVQEFLVQQYQG